MRFNPSADIPCFWFVSCQIAANQELSGVRVLASSVPAVGELWRAQARQAKSPRFVRQASWWPQAGQRKPSGQRTRSR